MRRRDVMKGGALAVAGMAVRPGPAWSRSADAAARATGLRVCGVVSPLALGAREPRFSWMPDADEPDAKQDAYRIIVARQEAHLAAGQDLVWDSGRVASADSFDIGYEGPPLLPRGRYWWQVETWDEAGRRSTSTPAVWETGLAEASDWSAKWLASEDREARLDREAGLHWIDGVESIPKGGTRYWRAAIPAEAGETGELLLSCSGLETVWLNGQVIEPRGSEPPHWTTMARYELPLQEGRNVLAITQGRFFYYNMPTAILAAVVRITDRAGRSRRLTSGSDWKASLSATQDWLAPDFDDGAWPDARAARFKPHGSPWPVSPAMHLRRSFRLDKEVRSARLYATALGAYEPWLNGGKVGDRRMAPELSDPSKRILYQAYDVTAAVRGGDNVLGLWVGDGWYGSEYTEGARFAFGPAPCRVLAQLEIEFVDGTSEIVGTGEGWEIAPSAIRSSEIYDGEIYDARREMAGWSHPGAPGEGWSAAELADDPAIAIDPQIAAPIRVTQELSPVSISEPHPGVYVVDFGQNFAGWARLKVRGSAGAAVEMRFAEILLPSGEVDQSNLRSAYARDTYILKGGAAETWEPRFTYHGFRYVELHGLPARPDEDTLTGVVAHNDLPVTGVFRVGDATIQKFWRNGTWSQRSNFFGLPTDCPQRDERVSWMGDAQVFWPAAAYNMDVAAYTHRVMGDVRAGQTDEGAFIDTIPPFVPGRPNASPGWADAGVILPYTAWQRYGDTAIIRDNWGAMERYLTYVREKNPDHLWMKARGADYADWLAVDAEKPGDETTPKDLIATAYWAADAAMMAEMADALGRRSDADRYRGLFATIRDSFVAEYVRADGQVGNGSQTSHILPIRFGLLSPAAEQEAGRRLAADIVSRGNKLSTGFLGTPHILDALDMTGHVDLAVTLLLQKDYPSWGYMVEQGATTMWERWNSDAGDRTMNSFNHYAFGAITDFLFRRIAGIAPLEPGFAKVQVAPVCDRRLGHGGADYRSISGMIRTDWRYSAGRLMLDVELPPGVSGEVIVPGAREAIRMNRRSLARSRDAVGQGASTRIEVGPGRHRFEVSA